MNAMSKRDSTQYLVLSACAALTLVGCGDDDGNSAKDKCETVARTYCDRAVECFEEADAFNNASEARDAQDECEADFEADAKCDRAVKVSENYGECLDALPRMNCAAIVNGQPPTPASCANVILWE